MNHKRMADAVFLAIFMCLGPLAYLLTFSLPIYLMYFLGWFRRGLGLGDPKELPD